MKKGEHEKERGVKIISLEAVILFCIFLVISIVFFVSLSIVSPPIISGTGEVVLSPDEEENFSFGIGKIIFSIVFGLMMAGFLLWTKSIIVKNAYLGSIIGLIGGGILGYAFSLRFRGPYSIGFMIASGLIVVGYLGKNFWKFKKGDEYIEGEFDDG